MNDETSNVLAATESRVSSACWCCGEPAPIRGEGDPWEGRMDGYCRECSVTRCDTTDSTCSRNRAKLQDRPPNFRNDAGELYLVRCFVCGGERGRENYVLAVGYGSCAWCGWTDGALDTDDSEASSPQDSDSVSVSPGHPQERKPA